MYDYLSHKPLTDHSHHCGHGHFHGKNTDKKILTISLCMTASMMFVQLIYSLLSHSLALLTDTLHMFLDVFALALSLLAIFIVEKCQNIQKTFGYFRIEVVIGFVNALLIILSTIFICYEAIEKLFLPVMIDTKTMIIIGFIGLLVNTINAFMMFKKADITNINIRSAFLHMMSDLFGSVAVIIGGIVMYFSGIMYIDSILALFLSLLLLKWALILLKQSANILLESSPVDIEKVRLKLLKNSQIEEIIDLHITQITNKMFIATMHLRLNFTDKQKFNAFAKEISSCLLNDFNIGHTTIQPLFKEKNEISDCQSYLPKLCYSHQEFS
ncbi:cation diffusion facilitator family transporter [Campylobacter sp. MIT 21-1685]|uniref:cation diffusion facilitator family transporter n=1 Tax=unclassified Campylobacter TaxID=2593542 RepID=UPI00224B7D8B|nr:MULTISPECIES: cation diffusion facilitator family transporter [unclassified Campylobacter]MCX2683678.1 cation diffusion facilitator family transporter [Campylobacter sp. MIT 21-1684]MCX2751963.1 cation diffusion facilitator family transporter [Campylobacter sp. MIT 21-1682]MCX2808175.1 cation diffusion facilitator family transporter [Campylobacter sp. MIT 21-1685]